MTPRPPAPGEGLLRLLGSPDHLPERLEEELVGPGLLTLVRDLEAMTGAANDPAPIPVGVRDRIVAAGLGGLLDAELQAVLARPRALLELQKAVLLRGSPYWDGVMRRADAQTEPADAHPAPARRSGVPRWLTHAVTAATAAGVVWLVTGSQLRQAREELQTARATTARLRDELQAVPPVLPADLPEGPTELVTADPPDLPEGDPPDLPESPKRRPAGV